MRISDWSSDVCSSDLAKGDGAAVADGDGEAFLYRHLRRAAVRLGDRGGEALQFLCDHRAAVRRQGADRAEHLGGLWDDVVRRARRDLCDGDDRGIKDRDTARYNRLDCRDDFRSEEQTSELQSLMRLSYAVLCLKKKES